SRDSVDDDVLRLTQMMLVAAALLLAAAPLSGYWLAGRATRPLGAILKTAARLRPDELVERLPLAGTGDELDRLASTINGLLDRLDNALKFTPPGGSVVVELGREASRAVVRVRDSGVGIAQEDLPRIFDRFYRADKSRTRRPEAPGSGLGLSICQALVSAHGG